MTVKDFEEEEESGLLPNNKIQISPTSKSLLNSIEQLKLPNMDTTSFATADDMTTTETTRNNKGSFPFKGPTSTHSLIFSCKNMTSNAHVSRS
jgi:hypothetical protein